jgi:hypothetical protein
MQDPGEGTGLFADEPNLPCGLFPDPICRVSDHNSTKAKLSCEHSADYDLSLASW